MSQLCIINYLLSTCVSIICCLCIYPCIDHLSIYLASIHHLPSIYLYSYLPTSITYLTTYMSLVYLYNHCHLCTYLSSILVTSLDLHFAHSSVVAWHCDERTDRRTCFEDGSNLACGFSPSWWERHSSCGRGRLCLACHIFIDEEATSSGRSQR